MLEFTILVIAKIVDYSSDDSLLGSTFILEPIFLSLRLPYMGFEILTPMSLLNFLTTLGMRAAHLFTLNLDFITSPCQFECDTLLISLWNCIFTVVPVPVPQLVVYGARLLPYFCRAAMLYISLKRKLSLSQGVMVSATSSGEAAWDTFSVIRGVLFSPISILVWRSSSITSIWSFLICEIEGY